MKLLYIVPRLGGAGGLERILLLKAGYLAEKMQYNVTVLITNTDDAAILYTVSPLIQLRYIKTESISKLSYFAAYRKAISKAVAQINPDIISVCDNGLKSFLLPWFLPKNIPLVYEMHAGKSLIKHEFFKNSLFKRLPAEKLLNFSLSKFTRFVALTTGGAAEWNLTNSIVIDNPLWFTYSGFNSLNAKNIVAMGRHAPQKGYERMFAVWQKIERDFPNWTLTIYGDHNPDYDLHKMAAEKKLERVIFSPAVKDIEPAYSNASLSVMTSVAEPFGMALIEAMEYGIPCLAYDCPSGPAAIINNGVNGFLIPDGDEQEYIKQLGLLIKNHELRLEMGREAKKTARTFNLETVMQQWDTLFKSLILGDK